ncbi:methyl-accepting chemotaxis protein [Candidatus Magnetaquicoccus inordinatus]|uniref:methyl-accepting chemotaxis protein n=1 Tax=Candidatus Magnetaquicoccus inordinatus TaxID=2496818 RepID=UPI00102B8F3D|nr:methyl-accepting chemotaxis protein [Candidatus Magnetaquicoccus inordinatus]
MRGIVQWAVQNRTGLFSRFSIDTWMRLTSGVSLVIFLAVITLNHLSLGEVQEINRDLYRGLREKDGWRLLSLGVAQAENIRMKVQLSRQMESAKPMQPLLAELRQQVDSLSNGAMEAIRADLQEYATAFEQLTEAIAQSQSLRLVLKRHREEIEIQIYELENRTLESALADLHLSEVDYLADPNEGRAHGIRVVLDRLARDASESLAKMRRTLDMNAYQQTLALLLAKDTQVVRTIASMEKTAQKITEDVQKQMHWMDQKMAKQVVATETEVTRTQWGSVIGTSIGVLLTVLIGLWVGQILQRYLHKVPKGLDKLASGDLSFHFEVPAQFRNELFQIMDAANRLADSLEKSIRAVLHVTDSVNHSSIEISAAMEQQSATAVQQVASVTEITCTMEELSSSSAQIADNARRVLQMSSDAWSKTNQSAAEMAVVIDRMKKITKANRRSGKAIAELGKKSVEITEIMNIINSIADQTKLLAFNAALEAASAGEAGKRFGVVAAEIRRLADSVMESTGHIAARVEQIHATIEGLVESARRDAQQVEEGMEISMRAARMLAEVVEGVGTTTDATQQISLATQQQETANRQILVALQGIEQGIQQSSVTINQTSQGIKAMAHLAQSQKEQVARFKLTDLQQWQEVSA